MRYGRHNEDTSLLATLFFIPTEWSKLEHLWFIDHSLNPLNVGNTGEAAGSKDQSAESQQKGKTFCGRGRRCVKVLKEDMGSVWDRSESLPLRETCYGTMRILNNLLGYVECKNIVRCDRFLDDPEGEIGYVEPIVKVLACCAD